MASFDRLVRFKSSSGQIHYGEAGSLKGITRESLLGSRLPTYQIQNPFEEDFKLSGQQEEVAEVLSPLEKVPIFLCIGLNYKQHAKEANMSVGAYPIVFTKPPDALAGPFEDISIHPECQNMDYEAELCAVIGKDCKNVSQSEDALKYVLGYTVGNDVSSRYWQMPERSNNQHGTAKSFDKFAPIGPVISSRNVISDPHQLKMSCTVNGEGRQSTSTDDMIFDLSTIIRHLSRGMTLRKGTVIMTGTPSGVAAFMKPPAWLKHGDVVEMEIENIGTIRNKIIFE